MTISLTKIELLIKELSRRMDAFQKAQDLAVSDRNILEDVLLRLEAVENSLHLSRERAGQVQKDLKADIHDLQGSVEDKVEHKINEVLNVIDTKKVVPVKSKKSWISKLIRR